MSIFSSEPEPERGTSREVAPKIRRMVAANGSSMTYHGTNTYFIESPDGLFVLDPGPVDDVKHCQAIRKEIGDQKGGILVSHHHSDHCGSAPKLREETGLPIFAAENFVAEKFTPDVRLADGDRIATLRVLHTPGHASDHLCFWRDDGVLFTGDHAMTWNSSIVALPDGDMAAYFSGLERLLAAAPRIILPGHGPVLADPEAFIRKLLEARLTREAEIQNLILKAPASVPEIAASLYKKKEKWLIWAAERNVDAHLDKLRKEGKVRLRNELWHVA